MTMSTKLNELIPSTGFPDYSECLSSLKHTTLIRVSNTRADYISTAIFEYERT